MIQGFNQSNIASLTGFNNLAMQNQNSTNQIIAQGTALASQLATCCCEIKEKIGSDGDETRALINSINLQNIQGQLADAKSQINNFNQTKTLLDSLTKREVRCDRDR